MHKIPILISRISIYLDLRWSHSYKTSAGVTVYHWNEMRTEEVSYIRIPVKFMDANGRTSVALEDWPIIDVHNTMAFLFNEAKIQIPGEALKQYWQTSKRFGEVWAQDVPEEEMEFTVPIGLYGDSARVDTNFNTEHIMAFFANILLWRPRSVRMSRFLVLAIPESRLTGETIQAILRRITWSCNHAFFGRWPKTDHVGALIGGHLAGKSLTPGNLKFQVTELRGDWSFHKKIWQWPKVQWNAADICHLCPVKGISSDWGQLYWNFEATHEDFSLTQYLAHRMPQRRICFLDSICDMQMQ